MPQRVILAGPRQRAFAHQLVDQAEDGAIITVAPATRSLRQNAMMWALLSDVSRAAPEGRHWPPATWKRAFMHLLGHHIRFCEGLDGSGPFPDEARSSELTVAQMGDLIEVILEYGARHGVEWTEAAAAGHDLGTSA